jgi:ABC-type nickel/cobalt efflux system permease component RcnA
MPRLRGLSRIHWLLLAVMGGLFAASVSLATGAQDAEAHPLGNFTVNRYSLIEVDADEIYLLYIVDMAEIPTFQELGELDTNGDGEVDERENRGYRERTVEELKKGLAVVVDGRSVELNAVSSTLGLPEGEAGLQTLRLETYLQADVPPGQHTVEFADENFAGRVGWQEVVVRAARSAELSTSTAPSEDQSQRLRAYEDSLLSSPLAVSEASFAYRSLPGGAEASLKLEASARPATEVIEHDPGLGSFSALVGEPNLSPGFIALAVLIAAGWGAFHALGPGHGKTIVAAYLVGSRSTPRHAAFLGLTVTVTHTSVVFALGLVTLYLSNFILPETLFLWLGVASGLTVVLLGGALVAGRLRRFVASRGHGHDHGHSHADGSHDHSHGHDGHEEHLHSHMPPGVDGPITLRGLLALGISGGLIPCPSALLVMLASITLGRVAFGLLLVTAFSVGLAGVLTAVGLIVLYGRGRLGRSALAQRAGAVLARRPWVLETMPVIAPVGVIIAGSLITYDALTRPGLFG